MKLEQSDKVVNTQLYIGTNFTAEHILYQGLAGLIKGDTTKTFGDRIKATFEDPNIRLTLSNLSFKDTLTFTLIVNLEYASLNTRPIIIKSVKIIEVSGKQVLLKMLQLITYSNLQQNQTD